MAEVDTQDRQKLRILVCGGGGAQGGPVAEQLLRRGHHTRILGRHAEKVETLIGEGAEFAPGDLGDRESLLAACESMDAVFFHMPVDAWPPKAYQYLDNMLEAVAARGVKHLVYTSSGAVTETKLGVLFIDIKSEFVRRIQAANVPATILLPPVFLDNLLAPSVYPDVKLKGVLAWPYQEDAKVSWITLEDHARHIVAALERPELAGRTLRIACSDSVTGPEVATHFGHVLGKPVRYKAQTAPAFFTSAGPLMGYVAAAALCQVFRYHRLRGSGILVVPEAAENSRLLGLEPMSFAESADSLLSPRAAALHRAPGTLDAYIKGLTLDNAVDNRGQLLHMFVEPETSGNTLSVWWGHCRRAVGPPVHIHTREHELFYVTEGKLTVGLEDEVFTLSKGQLIFLPANRAHWFMPTDGHVQMLGITVPLPDRRDGWKGTPSMFRATGSPATCLKLPPYPADPADVSALIRVSNEYGIDIVEPNPMVLEARRSIVNRAMRWFTG